jgi:hypothetical protein
MRLKCVGGPNDGLMQTLPDNYRVGDAWRVAQPPKEMLLSDDPTNLADRPTNIEYVEYVLDYLRFDNDTLYFLRHTSMSVKRAIFHQFSK